MKKLTILVIVFVFLLFGCDSGGSMEYDEETVKKEALEYLEDKYGGNYRFSTSVSPSGSNFVYVSFVDLDKSDESMTTLIIVTWYEDSGATSDYEDHIVKNMEYDEEVVRKEALEYLESKYDNKFEFIRCIGYSDYVEVVFDIPNSSKQKKIFVIWREDGAMTDNYEE